jgi:hypothetical protein
MRSHTTSCCCPATCCSSFSRRSWRTACRCCRRPLPNGWRDTLTPTSRCVCPCCLYVSLTSLCPCFVGPCFVGPCFVGPCFVGPCFMGPCFVGPCFVGPCFVGPCFVGPCFVGPCSVRLFALRTLLCAFVALCAYTQCPCKAARAAGCFVGLCCSVNACNHSA